VTDYRALIEQAGFQVIEALDRTEDFINFSEQELDRIETLTATPSVKQHLRSDWLAKIHRAREGNQRWGAIPGDKKSRSSSKPSFSRPASV
jgi:hypothetical protein